MPAPVDFLTFIRRSPSIAAGALCSCITGLIAAAIINQTKGLFVYPLDDSYIHLALAHNLAVHHVWGMNSLQFASASSSPGWTLVLTAAELLIGFHLTTPIFLNLILAFWILIVVDYAMVSFSPQAPRGMRYAISFAIVLVTPLPNLIIIGMEHVAQTLSVVLLVVLSTQVLATDPSERISARKVYLLLACAAVAGAIRYEAVFVIFPVFLLLLWRRRFLVALLIALSSAIGPVGFGLYSHHLSGFWLPYSVLTKTLQNDGVLTHLRNRLIGLATWPSLWTLLPIWLLRFRSWRFWDSSQLCLLLALTISVTHMLVAPIGWLMRYESYFVCLNIFSLMITFALGPWPREFRRKFRLFPAWARIITAAALFGLGGLLPLLVLRMAVGMIVPVEAAVDRYHEHIQMASFIASDYNHDTVVVNDIGAAAFYSNARLLDMIGLGSAEPLLARHLAGAFTSEDMARWATSQDASIAILQSGWSVVRSLTPNQWTLVQTWRLPRNIVFQTYDVSFYAVKPMEVSRLCHNLETFPRNADNRVVFNICPLYHPVVSRADPK
jgi:hypothetical protein